MFDFEKFPVYIRAKAFMIEIDTLTKDIPKQRNTWLIDQISRASMSIILNIAEGAGKYSRAEKRNYYTISRGSVFECVAILDIFLEKKLISRENKENLYCCLEELSKMLSGLIASFR